MAGSLSDFPLADFKWLNPDGRWPRLTTMKVAYEHDATTSILYVVGTPEQYDQPAQYFAGVMPRKSGTKLRQKYKSKEVDVWIDRIHWIERLDRDVYSTALFRRVREFEECYDGLHNAIEARYSESDVARLAKDPDCEQFLAYEWKRILEAPEDPFQRKQELQDMLDDRELSFVLIHEPERKVHIVRRGNQMAFCIERYETHEASKHPAQPFPSKVEESTPLVTVYSDRRYVAKMSSGTMTLPGRTLPCNVLDIRPASASDPPKANQSTKVKNKPKTLLPFERELQHLYTAYVRLLRGKKVITIQDDYLTPLRARSLIRAYRRK